MEKSKEASVVGAYGKRICVIVSKLETGQCHLLTQVSKFSPYSPEYFPVANLQIEVFIPLKFFQRRKN